MKRMLALALALLMLLTMAPAAMAADVIEVTIPHYKSGENVGAVFFLPQVERFNALYEGKYKLTIEELTQDLYAEKMQQLAIQNKLPALVEGGTTEWLADVVVPNGLYSDLTPFLEAHPEIKEQIPDYQIAYNTTADGKYVSLSYNVVRPIGMYYNTALTSFTKEPGEFANWDELLAEFGENKFAFMTGENAWTTALVLSGMIALEEGGIELLEAHTAVDNRLADYNADCIVNAVAKLQEVYAKYASSNTVGAVYADAANNFMSGASAIIANGSWMVGDFAVGSEDKWSNDFDGSTVKGAVFPGNVAIASLTGGYGWWIPATATAEEKELAEAFLAFMLSKDEIAAYCVAEGGSPILWNLSEETYAKIAEESPLMSSYTKAVNAETKYCPNILDVMPSSVSNTGFGSLLPLLFDGTYTPAQFCEQLTAMATEALED